MKPKPVLTEVQQQQVALFEILTEARCDAMKRQIRVIRALYSGSDPIQGEPERILAFYERLVASPALPVVFAEDPQGAIEHAKTHITDLVKIIKSGSQIEGMEEVTGLLAADSCLARLFEALGAKMQNLTRDATNDLLSRVGSNPEGEAAENKPEIKAWVH